MRRRERPCDHEAGLARGLGHSDALLVNACMVPGAGPGSHLLHGAVQLLVRASRVLRLHRGDQGSSQDRSLDFARPLLGQVAKRQATSQGCAVMKRVVWIRGKFRLTNQLLHDQRAAGAYAGFAKAKEWRLASSHDDFACHQAAVRMLAKTAARLLLPAGRLATKGEVVVLTFLVFGHGRGDADAWSLMGKAMTDGFVDSGALASDRFDLWMTGGRVLRTAAQERAAFAFLEAMVGGGRPPGFDSGVAIVVEVVANPGW